MIPYGRQSISQEDVDAVVEVLKSDWLTQGPAIPRFEQAVAQYVGVTHAVAVNSATSALHIACMALGLGCEDTLWTVPNTFVASANCGRYCGAEVDFVDINPVTFNIDVSLLEAKLKVAALSGRLPKVVVPVHFGGQSCDMGEIRKLADRYGFYIIEDASHAIGGRYHGEAIGACAHSDVTVFSFHPVKIITTGEGGIALTNNAHIAETMTELRTHGITRDPNRMSHPSKGEWYYEQLGLGYNYRMTDLQAALGLSQLQRLGYFVRRRRGLASRYDELLKDLPVVLPGRTANTDSAWHLYVIRILDKRDKVFEKMREAGIGVNVHYIPVHLQPYYREKGFKEDEFPEAERHAKEALTLPLYPDMSNEDQERVVMELRVALGFG